MDLIDVQVASLKKESLVNVAIATFSQQSQVEGSINATQPHLQTRLSPKTSFTHGRSRAVCSGTGSVTPVRPICRTHGETKRMLDSVRPDTSSDTSYAESFPNTSRRRLRAVQGTSPREGSSLIDGMSAGRPC